MTSPRRSYNNPGITDAGIAANRRRATRIGQRQAEQARHALAVLTAATTDRHPQWVDVLRHRADNPTASLRELAESMTPPMTKHAYAAQLRRALRAAQRTETTS
ncbi:MAG: helix-turn-helix domain-containing protein [Mycolicibacterium sp.]|uniref:helix-turn-helix domain-containing protein n=1 Tax=Mycolicibacterium sp. TaxID=2320850 RepID=UPI003D133A27